MDIENSITAIINDVHLGAKESPDIVIIHDLRTLRIIYMCPLGLQRLGLSRGEIGSLTTEEYHSKFFNEKDIQDYIPKVKNWIKRNSYDTLSFFQRMRKDKTAEWIWHFSSMKVLLMDKKEPLLSITSSLAINPQNHLTAKVQRILDENIFFKNHFNEFSSLTPREMEILKFTAMGMSSPEISRKISISITTVETHRRNIKSKLKANGSFTLTQYARAFNLI